ncbi:MAG: hypothetical protein Q9227_001139 [Pyrenula ochraceoflavens]
MVRHAEYPARSFSPHPSEDSENEDVNSPSDGYFSNTSHVPSDILVPDENNMTSASSDKAREAASESQSPTSYRHSGPSHDLPIRNNHTVYTPSTSRDNHTVYTPSTSRDNHTVYTPSTSQDSEDGYTESSPLLQEPPPLYEDAMAGRRRPDLHSSSAGAYGTNGHNQNVGSLPFIPENPNEGRQPQSMADRPPNPGRSDIHDEEAARTEALRPKKRGCFGWRKRGQNPNYRRKEKRGLFKKQDAGSNIGGGGVPHESQPPYYTEPSSPQIPQKPEKPSAPVATPTKSSLPSIPSEAPPKDPYLDPPTEPVPDSDRHRQTVITETSKSISGTYPLYDLLDITTTSGSISIYIDPQPAPSGFPNRTATLRINSRSGSVNIMGIAGLHPHPSTANYPGFTSRLYETFITTRSGSVSGNYIQGSLTEINTESGSISLALTPYSYKSSSDEADSSSNSAEASSKLYTSTKGGSTTLSIKPPVNTPSLRNLTAMHESKRSGSLTIMYPNVWEGEVDIRSYGSGSITAHGDGLRTINYGSQHYIGEKGDVDGGSKINLLAWGSGSSTFLLR